ncbi:cell envelope integrity EipB family protein [Tistrella mobilis]|uniref:cell envelope integrity EipB family protein n=1 Tax=Tistrella mobilis TaxID=171437 RepID=UPI00355902E5
MPLPSRSAAARRAVMSRLVVMPRLIAAGGRFRIGQGILGCVVAAGTAVALMPAALAAPHSVPHRAHYAMSLLKAQPDAAIAGVAGDMAVIFDRSCDGWSVLQASRMEIDFDEAEPVVSDILFDSEESDDGTRFRFRYEERENGESVELAIAHLDRTSPDRASKLRFANPPGVTESVPAGALLPTAHTERLLQAAEAGEAFIRAEVLTGSGQDSLSFVSAHIGRPTEIAADQDWPSQAGEAADALRTATVIPMRLAFFKPDDRSETPIYELLYQIQPNGVVRRFDIDYGEFAISARLVSVENRPAAESCD